MIGKKVRNAKRGGSKASRIGSLLDYIRAPRQLGSDEKCAYYGARGFVTDSPGGHRAEMIALAEDAARSSDPVNHYTLSWREGEVPMPDQIEQAVTLLLNELGLESHQAVYGLHSDTDNLHLHVAINRVHPDTLRVVKINGGFDLEALHAAVARIERAQGWQSESRARYQIDEAGRAVRSPDGSREARRPTQDKCDREAQTGFRSAERIAIEEAAPLIAAATTWKELHAALAEKGMRYERAGSGAKVFVGDVAIKASRVARDASFGRLEKRLGPYELAPEDLRVKVVEPRALRPELSGWKQYQEERAEYYENTRAAWERLRTMHARDRDDLRDRQQKQRDDVLSGSFHGRGHLLSSLRAALAEQQRAERQTLRRAHALAREHLREQHPRFPGLEQWLRDRGHEVLAEQWRYRNDAAQRPACPDPLPAQTPAAMYARYIAAWDAHEQARGRALGRVWEQHGRDVARQRAISNRRWSFVRLVAKGRVAGKLWALDARMADQRDWRRLHERHREAVRTIYSQHRPLTWSTWMRTDASSRDELGREVIPSHHDATSPPEVHAKAVETGATPERPLPPLRKGRSR